MATKTRKKAAPAPEVEETEDEDVELEELDAEVEDDEAPKAKKAKAQEVTFGVSNLCEYLSEKTGKAIKPRELRTLIRKMAREDDPRVEREIVPGNRTRYDWPKGLKDPEVKRIIAAVTGGEMEADKKEKLETLKAEKAKKSAAKKKQKAAAEDKPAKKRKKAAPVVEEVEDDDEVEELDLEDDDDE